MNGFLRSENSTYSDGFSRTGRHEHATHLWPDKKDTGDQLNVDLFSQSGDTSDFINCCEPTPNRERLGNEVLDTE